MKQRIRLLSLSAGATIVLLAIAGLLLVVGIFNEALNWDIFGPKMEALLYGVFGSSVALAAIGVAMTIVLGTQEIVKAFRSIQQQKGTEEMLEASKGTYAKHMLCAVLFLAAVIALMAGANHVVLKHRSNVFKRLASEQMEHFQPKFSELLSSLSTPPHRLVPSELHDFLKTLDHLSFIRRTTLYLPDPADGSAMWSYTAPRQYKEEEGFSRFFVAKEFEKAMEKAISGNSGKLEKLNTETGFTWFFLVNDQTGAPVAVLRIDGNSRENFREYTLGS